MATHLVPTVQRSLRLVAPQQLIWATEPLSPLGPHDLLLETQTGAISIGTEIPHYEAIPATYCRLTTQR